MSVSTRITRSGKRKVTEIADDHATIAATPATRNKIKKTTAKKVATKKSSNDVDTVTISIESIANPETRSRREPSL